MANRSCPTCRKPNCGNHAACARRREREVAEQQEWQEKMVELGYVFRAIAECERFLDETNWQLVGRDQARETLFAVLEAQAIVDKVWSRWRVQALLEAMGR